MVYLRVRCSSVHCWSVRSGDPVLPPLPASVVAGGGGRVHAGEWSLRVGYDPAAPPASPALLLASPFALPTSSVLLQVLLVLWQVSPVVPPSLLVLLLGLPVVLSGAIRSAFGVVRLRA